MPLILAPRTNARSPISLRTPPFSQFHELRPFCGHLVAVRGEYRLPVTLKALPQHRNTQSLQRIGQQPHDGSTRQGSYRVGPWPRPRRRRSRSERSRTAPRGRRSRPEIGWAPRSVMAIALPPCRYTCSASCMGLATNDLSECGRLWHRGCGLEHGSDRLGNPA
jgi:hypothetical protein